MDDPLAVPAGGLDEEAAARRLREEGPNELPRDRPPSVLATVAEVLREPMLLLLLAAAAIYLVLGDRVEALLLAPAALFVVGVTLVQERRTQRAVAALRDLTSPRALVVRGGARRRVAGREVVRGDLLVLSEGDRIAADALVVQAAHLEVDESLLTGESAPVRKQAARAAPPPARPGGDDQPFVYGGTLAVRGHGLAVVRATGTRSEMGRLGASLAGIEPGRTPLQLEVTRLVKSFAVVGFGICAALVLAHGVVHGAWLEGLLAGVALAMSMLPEEFPVILTIFMALGAWRISRDRVLTRRLPALEALGAATVLCADKTGTLTENRMRVAELRAGALRHVVGDAPLPEPLRAAVDVGVLASQPQPFDPTEQAFHRLAAATPGAADPRRGWELLKEYPLSAELLAVTHAWRGPDGVRLAAAKGAPEAIARLCRLPSPRAAALLRAAAEMGSAGLRVLALARAPLGADPPPGAPGALPFELVALAGLHDPLRPGVPEAVADCARAGIRVLMVTGDSPETARAVARGAGLDAEDVATGAELAALSDEALRARVRSASVFARTVPEQKLRLVQALRANGEVVAMTGDGVNDAPALKAAHIGVAMGGRGTDVAREAAALVVTDDDFTSIVCAVRLGRRVYDNLRRAMAYALAVHVPVAGLSLLPLLAGWPIVLFPIHIVFIELMVDPACSVAFEAEPADPSVMRRPPRAAGARLFDARFVGVALLQGASVLAASLAALTLGAAHAGSADVGRALSFAALVGGNVALIAVNRSWEHGALGSLRVRNRAIWLVVVGASLLAALAFASPSVGRLFRFGEASAGDLALAALAGFASLAWFEAVKRSGPARRALGWANPGSAGTRGRGDPAG